MCFVLQVGIGQLLSLVLRIHESHAVALPTVAHTASSTVRQVLKAHTEHQLGIVTSATVLLPAQLSD